MVMDIDIPTLQRYRTFAGFSIRQLAKESGLSHSAIAYIEKGERRASEATVFRLAHALGVEVEDLLNG